MLPFYFGMVVLAIILFYAVVGKMPDFNNCLCRWDCGWYKSMTTLGYVFREGQESNTAFFPLFPLTWKWLQLSDLQISLFNVGVFILAFLFLLQAFNIDQRSALYFHFIGLVTFFLIPYSESLFFLGSALFLIGLHRKNSWLLVIGFIVAVLARSAAIIFIAASIVLFAIAFIQKHREYIRLSALAVLTTLLTTAAVFYYQYLVTGVPFAFFKAQEHWDHHLGLPALPLSSWHWPVHLSDSSALMFGLFSIAVALSFCIRLIFKSTRPWLKTLFAENNLDYAYLFSILYLAGTTSTILLFQGGNIHSLNRYVFSTPFFLLFVHAFVSGKVRTSFTFQSYLVACICLGYILPRQTYFEHYLQVTLSVILFPASLLFSTKVIEEKTALRILRYSAWVAGFAYQAYLLSFHWRGGWMG